MRLIAITANAAANNNINDGHIPITNIDIPNNNGVNTPNTESHTTCLATEINNPRNGNNNIKVNIPRGNQLNNNESVINDKNLRLLESLRLIE